MDKEIIRSAEDQIYIGTEDGHVLQYKIDEDKQNPGQVNTFNFPTNNKYTFLQSRKRSLGKRKPVELHVFKDLLRIITICGLIFHFEEIHKYIDGTVDMLHLVNLEITNITYFPSVSISYSILEFLKTRMFHYFVTKRRRTCLIFVYK